MVPLRVRGYKKPVSARSPLVKDWSESSVPGVLDLTTDPLDRVGLLSCTQQTSPALAEVLAVTTALIA